MSPRQCIEGLIEARERECVLSELDVQWSVIVTHAETAVLLFEEHDRRGIGTATLPNYLCPKQLINVVFDHLIIRR